MSTTPRQEILPSQPSEQLPTGSQLNRLSNKITEASPPLLEARLNVLQQSWDDQQALSTQVPQSIFVNPYVQNAPDFRMAA